MSSHALWMNAAKETPRFCRVLARLSGLSWTEGRLCTQPLSVCVVPLCRGSVLTTVAPALIRLLLSGGIRFSFMPPQNGRCKESGDILLKTLIPFRERQFRRNAALQLFCAWGDSS